MTGDTHASSPSEEKAPDEETNQGKKDNRKNYRFDAQTIQALDTLKEATGITNETSLTTFTIHYAARHIPQQLTIKAQELREMQPSILGFASVLCAFYHEAERVIQEEGGSPDTIQRYGSLFLFDLDDPFATASLLLEKIGDRPVWLRHNWTTHYQYTQGKDILERALSDLAERYSKNRSSDRDDEKRDLLGGLEERQAIHEATSSLSSENYDPEGDSDEPSLRLYPEDIYALYQEVSIVAREKDAVFFSSLHRSVATLLPHLNLKKGSHKI